MQIHDLPISILLQVLPFEDSMLRMPKETIVQWLNLVPQRDLFRALTRSWLGKFEEKESKLYWETASGEEWCKRPDLMMLWRWFHKDLKRRFKDTIYINFGEEVTNEDYRKYVIYDFHLISDLVMEYTHLAGCFNIWTGGGGGGTSGEEIVIPFYMHFLALSFTDTTKHKQLVEIYHPSFLSNVEYCPFDLSELGKIALGHMLSFRQDAFEVMKKVELKMTIKQFENVKNHMIASESKKSLQPVELRIHLHLPTRDDQADVEADTIESPPLDFPVDWLTSTFDLGQVKVFQLEYYTPETSITKIDTLLNRMPKLKWFELSLGKLCVPRIVELLNPQVNYQTIHLIISQEHYQSHTFQFQSQWKTFGLTSQVMMVWDEKKERVCSTWAMFTLPCMIFKLFGQQHLKTE